ELILKELVVCVVMLTAYDLEEHKSRAAALGACGYILKPVTSSTLIPQLEAAYAQYQNRRQ
ncbi:MAG TPA: hypothetical protein VKT77_12745, partial [Chthonomonadaceae bacterium]|nr:hypothetical protein [Chthonomonadaceae bacterium]